MDVRRSLPFNPRTIREYPAQLCVDETSYRRVRRAATADTAGMFEECVKVAALGRGWEDGCRGSEEN